MLSQFRGTPLTSSSWHTNRMPNFSAQSIVSSTNVPISSGCLMHQSTVSMMSCHFCGGSKRATSMWLVLPSVSQNTAPGNRLAKVLFPIPSGP